MRRAIVTPLALGVFLVGISAAMAADWPQYRGPEQTGISAEKVDVTWGADGPKVVWKIPTKNGFSSFSIADGKVFTQVNRDVDGQPREMCVALDAKTGEELWAADVDNGRYDGGADAGTPDNNGGDGPRSTPTVDDGMVYVYTQQMVLHCINEKTGKSVWSRDIMKEHAGRNIGWKSAASPVVDGNFVFVFGGGPGQSLLAINKKNGKTVWAVQDEMCTHATPTVATILKVKQVIYFCQSGLVSVAAKDGKLLWKFPFRYNVSTAASPVVSGDIVYCSAGYDVGGGACRIVRKGAGFEAEELWKTPGNKDVANHWSTPVCQNGYLYGMFSFKKFGNGPLKCVEVATGKVMWEKPGFGAGNVILVGDKVLALADNGELVVVKATPEGYQELARTKAIQGKCWSTPSFSDGRIYVRSTKEGACLDPAGK